MKHFISFSLILGLAFLGACGKSTEREEIQSVTGANIIDPNTNPTNPLNPDLVDANDQNDDLINNDNGSGNGNGNNDDDPNNDSGNNNNNNGNNDDNNNNGNNNNGNNNNGNNNGNNGNNVSYEDLDCTGMNVNILANYGNSLDLWISYSGGQTVDQGNVYATESGLYEFYVPSWSSNVNHFNQSFYFLISNYTNVDGYPDADQTPVNCSNFYVVQDEEDNNESDFTYAGTFWLDQGSNTLSANHFCQYYQANHHQTDGSSCQDLYQAYPTWSGCFTNTCGGGTINPMSITTEQVCVRRVEG